MKTLTLDNLEFSNRNFWTGFIASSFPTALDEETDTSLVEIIEENKLADIEWWSNFTEYYDGVLEEADGYIDNPKTLICNLTSAQTLKIEFHPGDIVYYINDNQIACTGPEYNIKIFPFTDLLKYPQAESDNRIFLLLLPLTTIYKEDMDNAIKIISNILTNIFCEPFCNRLASSIVYGLAEE